MPEMCLKCVVFCYSGPPLSLVRGLYLFKDAWKVLVGNCQKIEHFCHVMKIVWNISTEFQQFSLHDKSIHFIGRLGLFLFKYPQLNIDQ